MTQNKSDEADETNLEVDQMMHIEMSDQQLSMRKQLMAEHQRIRRNKMNIAISSVCTPAFNLCIYRNRISYTVWC